MNVEAELRTTLRRAAASIHPSHDQASVHAADMDRLAGRRAKRRAAVLASGLAAALIVVAVPVGLSRVDSSPTAAPTVQVYNQPTRGSLAGDAAFVAGVRQLSWASPGTDPATAASIPDPPVDTRRVVFAGDVTGGRWALIAGQDVGPGPGAEQGGHGGLAAVWFVGPPGAAPTQMEMAGVPTLVPPSRPSSLYDEQTGALVVVGAPGDEVETSPRPIVASDATISRVYTDAGAIDGVAVVTSEPNPYPGMPAIQFTVSRGGSIVTEQPPDGYSFAARAGTPPAYQPPAVRPPVGAAPDPTGRVSSMAAELLASYGFRPDQVDIRAQYVGPVPSETPAPTELEVLTMAFPSGAVLLQAGFETSLGTDQMSYGGGRCANTIQPAGLPVAERVFAWRCDIGGGVDDQVYPTVSSLIVLAPPQLAGQQLTVTGTGAPVPATLDATGVAIIAFPDGAQTVQLPQPDGTVREATITTH